MNKPYLQRRENGTYYFRFIVPKDLIAYSDLFGGRDVHRSLRTKDSKLAKIQIHSQMARYELIKAILRSKLLPDDQLRHIAKMLLGLEVSKQDPLPPTPKHREKATPNKDLRLSRLIELYTHEHAPTWVEKTKAEYSSEFHVLLRLMGDRPIQGINREECVAFRDRVLRLPPNSMKKIDWNDKTLPKNKSSQTTEKISPITANKYLVLLSSLLKWAAKQDYIVKNPAEGLKIPVRRKASDERAIYTQDELQQMISFLPKIAKKPEHFWIPLIALYSGMRQGEICQLETRDIREENGIIFFDINTGPEKEVKTPASIRQVPLHPALIEMGFCNYVQSQRVRNEPRLWSHLRKDKFGYWTREFSRWYRSFNRDCITEDPKKCFHSFRHTFADRLKQSDVPDVLISELLGHANPNISTGRYGKPYHLDKLLQAVKQADFDITLPPSPPYTGRNHGHLQKRHHPRT
jgi:integrase